MRALSPRSAHTTTRRSAPCVPTPRAGCGYPSRVPPAEGRQRAARVKELPINYETEMIVPHRACRLGDHDSGRRDVLREESHTLLSPTLLPASDIDGHALCRRKRRAHQYFSGASSKFNTEYHHGHGDAPPSDHHRPGDGSNVSRA